MKLIAFEKYVIEGLIFKEQNKRKKLTPLAGIMLGVGLILYS
jgi:hypothetical protein